MLYPWQPHYTSLFTLHAHTADMLGYHTYTHTMITKEKCLINIIAKWQSFCETDQVWHFKSVQSGCHVCMLVIISASYIHTLELCTMTFPLWAPPSAAAERWQFEWWKKPYKSTKLMDGPETDILYTPRGFPVVTWMMSTLPSEPVRTEHPGGHASHPPLSQTQCTAHVVYVALINFNNCTPLCAFTIDIWSDRSVYAHTTQGCVCCCVHTLSSCYSSDKVTVIQV